jgi:hypothetical protein
MMGYFSHMSIFPEVRSKATETSPVARSENHAEILKTLFTIVSGIPQDRSRDTMKSRDAPVNVERLEDDDYQQYKYVLVLKRSILSSFPYNNFSLILSCFSSLPHNSMGTFDSILHANFISLVKYRRS